MVIQPRAYQDEQDLEAMRRILVAGRQSGAPTHYVHLGDLHWWLFYLNQEDDRRQTISLWETNESGKDVVGWTLFSPGFVAFDVFVHPVLRASAQAAHMWIWSEEQMTHSMRAQGEQLLSTIWVGEHDTWLNAHLARRGFVRTENTMLHLGRTLVSDLPNPTLPAGYYVRSVAGEHEVERRAEPAYAAFHSGDRFKHYWPRYLNFMRSPVYHPDLDLVVVAPDGRFAAFCLCWLDVVNQVGYVEPVGVHPDFQRQGLARAVLQEGLRQMQARGMTMATVCVEGENRAAAGLYAALGFRPLYQIYAYSKKLL